MQRTMSSERGLGKGGLTISSKDTSPHTALLIQDVGDWGEEIARKMKTLELLRIGIGRRDPKYQGHRGTNNSHSTL